MLEQLDAFIATKVAVAIKLLDVNVLEACTTLAGLATVEFEVDCPIRVVPSEKAGVLTPVACCDSFPQAEFIEVDGKVAKEVAGLWVVAVAIDHFAFEVVFVVLQFELYIVERGVELVLLRLPSFMKVTVAFGSIHKLSPNRRRSVHICIKL